MNLDNDHRVTYDGQSVSHFHAFTLAEFVHFHKIAGLEVNEETLKFEFEKIGLGGPAILFDEFTAYMAKHTAAPELAKHTADEFLKQEAVQVCVLPRFILHSLCILVAGQKARIQGRR